MINTQFDECKVCGREKKYSMMFKDEVSDKMVHVNGCVNFCDSKRKPRVRMEGSNPVYKVEANE